MKILSPLLLSVSPSSSAMSHRNGNWASRGGGDLCPHREVGVQLTAPTQELPASPGNEHWHSKTPAGEGGNSTDTNTWIEGKQSSEQSNGTAKSSTFSEHTTNFNTTISTDVTSRGFLGDFPEFSSALQVERCKQASEESCRVTHDTTSSQSGPMLRDQRLKMLISQISLLPAPSSQVLTRTEKTG